MLTRKQPYVWRIWSDHYIFMLIAEKLPFSLQKLIYGSISMSFWCIWWSCYASALVYIYFECDMLVYRCKTNDVRRQDHFEVRCRTSQSDQMVAIFCNCPACMAPDIIEPNINKFQFKCLDGAFVELIPNFVLSP